MYERIIAVPAAIQLKHKTLGVPVEAGVPINLPLYKGKVTFTAESYESFALYDIYRPVELNHAMAFEECGLSDLPSEFLAVLSAWLTYHYPKSRVHYLETHVEPSLGAFLLVVTNRRTKASGIRLQVGMGYARYMAMEL